MFSSELLCMNYRMYSTDLNYMFLSLIGFVNAVLGNLFRSQTGPDMRTWLISTGIYF